MDDLLENFSAIRSPRVRRALLELLRRPGGGAPSEPPSPRPGGAQPDRPQWA